MRLNLIVIAVRSALGELGAQWRWDHRREYVQAERERGLAA